MLNTPVDRIRCSLVDELRVPARVTSLSVLPSPLSGRVGVHITTFEACSSFTRVTACKVAHPPYVGFIARLRPGRFPGSGARKLPSSTNNLLGWVLPPLVICAVEAHPKTPSGQLVVQAGAQAQSLSDDQLVCGVDVSISCPKRLLADGVGNADSFELRQHRAKEGAGSVTISGQPERQL